MGTPLLFKNRNSRQLKSIQWRLFISTSFSDCVLTINLTADPLRYRSSGQIPNLFRPATAAGNSRRSTIRPAWRCKSGPCDNDPLHRSCRKPALRRSVLILRIKFSCNFPFEVPGRMPGGKASGAANVPPFAPSAPIARG